MTSPWWPNFSTSSFQPLIPSNETSPLGLTVNWGKTKIQSLSDFEANIPDMLVNGERVEAAEDFIYLGVKMSRSCQSSPVIARRIGMARQSMKDLDVAVWRSSLTLRLRPGFTTPSFFLSCCMDRRHGRSLRRTKRSLMSSTNSVCGVSVVFTGVSMWLMRWSDVVLVNLQWARLSSSGDWVSLDTWQCWPRLGSD